MTDQMTRLQEEAEKRYPYPASGASNFMDKADESEWKQSDFIAGRTISAEELEEATKVAYEHERAEAGYRWPAWDECDETTWGPMRAMIRAAFEAAGMVIEG